MFFASKGGRQIGFVVDAATGRLVGYHDDTDEVRLFPGTRGFHGVQQVWNNQAFPSGTPVTIQNQIPAMGPFRGLRVLYKNPTTTEAMLHDCRVASPTGDGSDGSSLVWTPGTFAGGSAKSLPGASGVQPNMVYSYVVSDFIGVSAANDAMPIAMIRSRFEISGCAMNPPSGALAAFNAVSGLPPFKTGFSLGSGVVADTTGIPMTEGQLICPAAVEFYYDRPTTTVMWAGGSTLWGQGSEGDANGFMYRACRSLTTPGRIVSPLNVAYPGQGSTATHLASLPALLEVVRPQIVVLLPGSGNDPDLSESGFALMRGRFAAAVEAARRVRAEVLAVTLAPSAALSDSQDALRREQNLWLKQTGLAVADIAAVLEDPADPSRVLPGYDSGDGTHFAPLGHAAAEPVVRQMLVALIND